MFKRLTFKRLTAIAFLVALAAAISAPAFGLPIIVVLAAAIDGPMLGRPRWGGLDITALQGQTRRQPQRRDVRAQDAARRMRSVFHISSQTLPTNDADLRVSEVEAAAGNP